jgi:hypothetical protein
MLQLKGIYRFSFDLDLISECTPVRKKERIRNGFYYCDEGRRIMRFRFTAGAVLFCLATLPAVAAQAAGDEEIRQAVERGVAYLKNHRDADGSWSYREMGRDSGGEGLGHNVGVSSLVGLALLECGVAADDPVVQVAAKAVREGIAGVEDTYDVSLAIMFLDRLGAAGDNALIEAASLRLLAGQMAGGGWGYYCPTASTDGVRRLRTLVEQKNAISGARPSTLMGGQLSAVAKLSNKQVPFKSRLGEDNSNTQFANLALWIARRHNVKADFALAAVEHRFLNSQNKNDGGWGYKTPGSPVVGFEYSTASMTCAGLLGLAVGYGVANQAILRTDIKRKPGSSGPNQRSVVDPRRDAAIAGGLKFLGSALDTALPTMGREEPADPADGDRRPPGRRGRGPARRSREGRPNLVHNGWGSEYYFLWSLERVAVVYGLKTIENKDWYAIGADYLVEAQDRDGAWRGNIGDTVDTCFALFFLRRANLAGDLTATLRGRIKDPGVVNLKAGGVGGQALQQEASRGAPAHAGQTPGEASRAASAPGVESGARTPHGAETEVKSPASTKHKSARTKEKLAPADSGRAASAESPQAEVARLRDALVKAGPDERTALLNQLRDSKGSVHTDALAAAIPLLKGADRAKASDTLAERLARMTPATLRDKLQDGNVEIRRAAALACAMKEDKTLIPDLIRALGEPDQRIARAAHASLVELTRQDFGPSNNATNEERNRALRRWREWLQKKDK